MKLESNTIVITGGSSGIGLELAGRLLVKGNQVIVCGRSAKKLERAQSMLPRLVTHQCDLSDADQVASFASWLRSNHPGTNVLINNAAVSHVMDFIADEGSVAKASIEIQTNLLAPILLTKQLFSLLEGNREPKLINVTTGLVYAPRANYPIYNATKAALHSFTQVLRIQQAASPVQVIEVLFPAVDTPWHNGNPPKIAIPVGKAVDQMIAGLESGRDEIKIGGVKLLHAVTRVAPGFALKKINSVV